MSAKGGRKGGKHAPQHAPGREEGFAIWGVNPVAEALRRRPGWVKEVLLAGGNARLAAIYELARRKGVPVRSVSRPELPGSGKQQGVAAWLRRPSFLAFADLLDGLPAGEPFVLLALDQVQDPRNFGAILRCAAAVGVRAVLFPRHGSAPLSGAAWKASAGTAILVDCCQVPNLAVALQQLRDRGVWLYGADLAGSASLFATDFAFPLCLVVGGEGRGLRPLVRRQCDALVRIPMSAGVESLNVAVSTGVLLYEIRRQSGIAPLSPGKNPPPSR